MSERIGSMDWDSLHRLLRPLQIQIIEALDWIGRPLSASELMRIFDEEESLSNVAYNTRRLAELRFLKVVGERKVRGAVEKFYAFTFPSH